ncbi:coniferyl aldehyde dehydrogenase [Pectobacterium polaris]|uniref:coniferyl aldehyde dehydrogenase n=1 Tax=Pectobacterium polaris TaxID=2042057 RepID=UPI00158286E7|nr:coniferyl aldehyde dehydrogenase [Pectobacterium polaris]
MSTQQSKKDLQAILNTMKRAHIASGPADAALRQDRLQRSINLLRENHATLAQAMSDDFGHRSLYHSFAADIGITLNMLQNAIDNVERWMQPESVDEPAPGMQAWIQHQPLGVIGVISPWNFPVNLSFGPLADIFAAGNTAILKPSELTPRTSELLAELIAHYFDPLELAVVLGDAEIGQAFSELPFDHLVFTGSTAVGKHVMRAAAENLVPVTLELGGKSPVVIDRSADITEAVERTLTVKTFNAGQICLSPDYVLLPEGQEQAFRDAAKAFMQKSFPTLQANPDYTSIIADKHYDRLIRILKEAEQQGATVVSLAPEGEASYDAKSRKIAPHLVFGVHDDMTIMQEEIFGPLLPIKTYQAAEEPINYINAHPRPLAAYLFSNDEAMQQRFAARTTSGALVINDVMTHVSIDTLPFGGVGASGIGAYHGVHGFRRFSHAKPIVIQSEDGSSNLTLRAPYHEKQDAIVAVLKG